MKPMNSLVALGAAAVLVGSTLVAAPASAVETSVPKELVKNGGEIEVVVAVESKTLEISPRKSEAQKKTPVPCCSYKAKNQAKVRTTPVPE